MCLKNVTFSYGSGPDVLVLTCCYQSYTQQLFIIKRYKKVNNKIHENNLHPTDENEYASGHLKYPA